MEQQLADSVEQITNLINIKINNTENLPPQVRDLLNKIKK